MEKPDKNRTVGNIFFYCASAYAYMRKIYIVTISHTITVKTAF